MVLMTDATTTASSAQPVGRWPYRLRLIWFVALIVLSTLWFERHLKAFVSQTAIIGGTVTLFGLWKLLLDAVGTASREGPGDWMRRAFASRRATEYLGFASILLAALYLCTSSIYLTYESDSRGSGSYTVEIWQGNRQLEAPEKLNSYDRFRGQPYFFHFGREELEFRIVDPPGYEPKVVPWRAGSQITVCVPRCFDPKQLHLVQIVPGATLIQDLPNEPIGLRYRLQLRRIDVTGTEFISTVEPYLKTVVYTGMSAPELALTASETARAATRREVQSWLTRLQVASADSMVEQLFARPVYAGLDRLVKGDRLTMTVSTVKTGDDGAEVVKVIAEQDFTVPSDRSAAHFIFLERLPGDGP
jgi:hypothetical protein